MARYHSNDQFGDAFQGKWQRCPSSNKNWFEPEDVASLTAAFEADQRILSPRPSQS